MSHIKTISVLLLTSMLLTAAVSCSSDTGNANETVNPEQTSGITTEVSETDYIEDVLPEKNYDGKAFRMYMRHETNDKWQGEMYVEETNGDLMNDAIFERNSRIEELYNVNIAKIDASADNGAGAEKAILAGEDSYDLIVAHARQSFIYVQSDLVVDWHDLPYVDLDQPWWNQDARRSFTINGHLGTMVGDISYLDFGSANSMIFNKELIKNYSLPNPYELVSNDQWNFDKFGEIAVKAVADLNGDSVIDYENDRMGYLTSVWLGPIQVLYSSGERICRIEDNFMKLTLNTPRTVEAFEKFFSLGKSEGVIIKNMTNAKDTTGPFSENRVLFFDTNIKNTSRLRDMDADFGIVPWPKLNESVDNYYSNVDAGCSSFTVPKTSNDLEFISLILEAMGCIGYTEVIPLYYDVVLTTKNVRDDISIEMLEIINKGRVFDVGYYYNHVGDIASIGRYLCDIEDHNFASYYASKEAATLANIEQINALYR